MILLDTHTFLWWVSSPELLSETVRSKIDDETQNGKLLVSSISIWEIYMLVKGGRLTLTMDVDAWLEAVQQLPYIQFIPIDNRIAGKSVELDNFHSDPADRFIVATAREYGVILVTKDQKILNYSGVQTVW